VLGIGQAVELPPVAGALEHPGGFPANPLVDGREHLGRLVDVDDANAGSWVRRGLERRPVGVDSDDARSDAVPVTAVDGSLRGPEDG
jgi:hypothetical protein